MAPKARASCEGVTCDRRSARVVVDVAADVTGTREGPPSVIRSAKGSSKSIQLTSRDLDRSKTEAPEG
jgi:hypothetical protein